MDMLCRRKLGALIALGFASHVVYAEPPPVQNLESATGDEASIDSIKLCRMQR